MPQQHCDPDVLAMAAVDGTDLSEADREHLATCAQCADELAGFRSVVAVGRDSADVALVTPPPSVWEAVQAEIRPGSDARETSPTAGGATVDIPVAAAKLSGRFVIDSPDAATPLCTALQVNSLDLFVPCLNGNFDMKTPCFAGGELRQTSGLTLDIPVCR